MMQVRKFCIYLAVLCSLTFNYGCLALIAAGVLTGAGEYVKYNLNSTAHRTYTRDIHHITPAVIDVLGKMKIQVKNVKKNEQSAKIYAFTKNLSIKVYLHRITGNMTKVTINASLNPLMKDKATANEIISQIGLTLRNEYKTAGRSAI